MSAQTTLVDALRLKLSLRGALDPDVEEMILRLRGMAELRDDELAKKHRKFTRSDIPRLDEAIRRILDSLPADCWPTSKAVLFALEDAGFSPMPPLDCVRKRLRLIRGPNKKRLKCGVINIEAALSRASAK